MRTEPVIDQAADCPAAASPGFRRPEFRTGPVIFLGLPLAFASFLWVVESEEIRHLGLTTGIAIYYHVVVLFALLIAANKLVFRLTGGKTFLSRVEMLCLYSMMNIGSCYACWESLGTLVPAIAYPEYAYATRPSASWLGPVIADLPSWAIVKNPDAARAIFQGAGGELSWRGWLLPLLAWASILSAMFVMFLALTRLLWESWTHHERLSFPLTALPLEMTKPTATLWRSKAFWITAAATLCFDVINGLSMLFPSLPALSVKASFVNTNAVSSGWQAVGPIPLTFYPLMIGIGLLLRTDLLFSTWFFYLMGKIQLYLAGILAVSHGSPYVFLNNSPGLLAQNFGAIFVLSISLLWNARRMLIARAFAARHGNREAIIDFALIAGGSLVLTCALTSLGLPMWLSLLSLGIVILLAVFVSRLRAELGLPVHNLQFMGPGGPLTALFDGQGLTQHAESAFGAFFAATRSQQGHPMPYIMESAYTTDRAQGPISGVWKVLAVTGIATAFAGPWIVLKLLSQHGGIELLDHRDTPISAEGWRAVSAFISGRHLPDTGAISAMVCGAIATMGLMALQRLWIGSPFHPVGYAICGSWGTGMVWMPFLIAWAAKSLILRYGGGRAYTGVSMFGLGLIAGEFAAGAFWTAISLATGVQCYQILF